MGFVSANMSKVFWDYEFDASKWWLWTKRIRDLISRDVTLRVMPRQARTGIDRLDLECGLHRKKNSIKLYQAIIERFGLPEVRFSKMTGQRYIAAKASRASRASARFLHFSPFALTSNTNRPLITCTMANTVYIQPTFDQ